MGQHCLHSSRQKWWCWWRGGGVNLKSSFPACVCLQAAHHTHHTTLVAFVYTNITHTLTGDQQTQLKRYSVHIWCPPPPPQPSSLHPKQTELLHFCSGSSTSLRGLEGVVAVVVRKNEHAFLFFCFVAVVVVCARSRADEGSGGTEEGLMRGEGGGASKRAQPPSKLFSKQCN